MSEPLLSKNDSARLFVLIRLEALITDREGMVAENKQREHRGESMAYPETAFADLAANIRRLEEALPYE